MRYWIVEQFIALQHLAALQRKTDLTNESALAELARHLDIQFIPQNGEVNILLAGMNVSHLIRTQESR